MRRRQYILLVLVLFVSMTSCLYYAIFGDFSFVMKTCFGIAAALLYAMINLIPFFAKRRELIISVIWYRLYRCFGTANSRCRIFHIG